MASLCGEGLVFAPFTTTAKKSSVHMTTTSYAAEVVSPLPKPQPQLKNTPQNTMCDWVITILQKNRYFHRSL